MVQEDTVAASRYKIKASSSDVCQPTQKRYEMVQEGIVAASREDTSKFLGAILVGNATR